MTLLERTVARIEGLLKGVLFDCRSCGQCVLSTTGLVCPMACPKGLRNGPCGGTLAGECEVYPDRRCVWVRIHETKDQGVDVPPLLPSLDASLIQTSSVLNYLRRKDIASRTPLPYLDLGSYSTSQPLQTPSRLEARLKAGDFVKTTEIRSPREAGWRRVSEEADLLRPTFDAVNATAYLTARPSIPSPATAAFVAGLGLDTIAQATGRDHTKTSFISELIQNAASGVHNVLCLTGDAFVGSPSARQVFDMDAALMLYEARHLRERGVIHFTGDKVRRPPKPFLGAAINPFTRPIEVPVRRIRQKAAAGADFIQTQLVFDLDGFREFVGRCRAEGVFRDLFLLAGIPVVVSKKAFEHVFSVPGVAVPPHVAQRLSGAGDIREEGVRFARELVDAVRGIPGVSGVHLMLFGSDVRALCDVIEGQAVESLSRG